MAFGIALVTLAMLWVLVAVVWDIDRSVERTWLAVVLAAFFGFCTGVAIGAVWLL